jgi:perosamine synthetase
MNEKLALLGGRAVLSQPLQEPNNIGDEEIEEAIKVLKTGRLSCFVAKYNDEFFGGPWVRKLEDEFKDYFGSKFAVSMNSATSALFASVYALGISPGDEVIVPPYTMSATATCILACSAVPVFVDVDSADFCIDAQKIEQAVTEKTKAIIVVHLLGNPARMDRIMAIAGKYNLSVIEDCAQAPGAVYKDRYAGTFGDVGIYSLNKHKTIQTGEGGVIITNNDRLALKLQLIRNHAEVVADQMAVPEEFNLIGWNYRMAELEAAIGSIQIKRLDKLNAVRIANAEYLSEGLKEFSWLIPNKLEPCARSVYYRYPFRYIKENIDINRHTFANAMKAEGFPLNEGYVKPIYLQSIYQRKNVNVPYLGELYRSDCNYSKGLCPVVENLYENEFLFSPITHTARDKRDLDLFISAIRKVELNLEELKKFEQNS